MGCSLWAPGSAFVTVFLPRPFWKSWTGICSVPVSPENLNLINLLCIHLVREQQEQDARQGKGRWELSMITGQAEAMASLAREQRHSTQTGRVTATRAEPAHYIAREVYSQARNISQWVRVGVQKHSLGRGWDCEPWFKSIIRGSLLRLLSLAARRSLCSWSFF